MDFGKNLISWYLNNKRNLPWRNTKDPYFIWLSEVILQQTKVIQGISYYFIFTKSFPTIFDLANAKEEKILKLWQGLGYYSRARNLHFTAKMVANNYNGIFPNTYSKLIKLKGVGDYTASAIASICFDEVQPVVDGNVYRVLSRYFGIDTPIQDTKAKKVFKELALTLIDQKDPATFNQAIMEFGAMQCKPKNPNCTICHCKDTCYAYLNGKIDQLPVKRKKSTIKTRYFHYFVFVIDKQKIVLQQRKGDGIWKHLYQFPLLETPKKIRPHEVLNHDFVKQYLQNSSSQTFCINKKPIIHKLTHQHLHTQFYYTALDSKQDRLAVEASHIIPINQMKQYPVPILIHNFIEKHLLPNLLLNDTLDPRTKI